PAIFSSGFLPQLSKSPPTIDGATAVLGHGHFNCCTLPSTAIYAAATVSPSPQIRKRCFISVFSKHQFTKHRKTLDA
ncbi:MAG TPA: hypothetical protein VM639_12115, partial [Dongiaceae bacterium]|nr:hypothetical protein [Dongiaceae bacterium]